jgi:FAD:protein FMN transferase
MKETRNIMGMPITVEIVDKNDVPSENLESVFDYFTQVDERFSTYKKNSEIMRINRKEVREEGYSPEMREVFALAEKTKIETNGFFDIKKPNGSLDPSGIVKGWAIQKVAEILHAKGELDFCIEAGGDIQTSGHTSEGKEWSVGIRNPLKRSENEIIKILYPRGCGVATSGSYERGAHIYNPHDAQTAPSYFVSITVIGSNILEADRFATAAFAMGRAGVVFIENLFGFEAYAIDADGIATMTSGFDVYTHA